MTTSSASDREELLQIILRDGILYRSPTQPVLSRDGSSARWILDTLAVSMQPRGAELAGRCLLELLEKFDGRQIATYGTTGIPLMQSAIMQSRGRYHGLIVRKEKKAHGSLKRIEGRINLQEPTIMLDDSVSSGLCMREGAAFLEEAGLRVEGGVALVRFGWDGGVARMRERGYHMEAVFDVWLDLMENMPDEPNLNRNPARWLSEFPWSDEQAPEGLHPAQLARLAISAYLTSGKLPRPPLRLDSPYDSRGGVWISLRDRDQIYYRYARDGFWTFPGEAAPDTPEDLLRAVLQTAKRLEADCEKKDAGEARRILDRSHIAVTFFTPLEKCHPGQLDNDRYGIVVCSRERLSQMGGALPRMPGIANEWEQFRHAHRNNARLYSFEPFDLYRHELRKVVEPGVEWQPSGVPLDPASSWYSHPSVAAPAARALDILRASLGAGDERTQPLPDDLFPAALHSLYVSVYLDGRLRGCAGSAVAKLDRDIRILVEAALRDDRFDQPKRSTERIAVTVSLLFNRLELGAMSAEEVAPRFRLGKQALAVEQNRRYGMLLPFVAVTDSLSAVEYAAEVIDKAGITRPPYYWTRFDCATWLADSRGVDLIDYGFRPPVEPYQFAHSLRELSQWQCGYLLRNIREDGGLYSTFQPFQNWIYKGHCTARSTHATWILMKAARALNRPEAFAAAIRLLDHYLAKIETREDGLWLEENGTEPSVAELSFLLLTLAEIDPVDSRRAIAARIASALWSRIDMHGHIETHRNKKAQADDFQDYFPGQTLLALAAAARAGFAPNDPARLRNALLYYRHRFRHKRHFGQVSWLMQAGRAWWQIDRDSVWADLTFEIAGWICEYQSEKSGAFITPLQDDGPGYTTALYLEGLAAAADLANSLGDRRRYAELLNSCDKGFRFLRRLTILPEHDSMLPNPDYALGGLRRSLTASEVRLDFVQHSLAAALDLLPHLESSEAFFRPTQMGLDQPNHEPALQPGD